MLVKLTTNIKRLSRKFGEQAGRVRPHARLGPNTDGVIATWGKVTLEPLDASGITELVAGRSPRKGILVDFLGSLSESARRGLEVYRVSGGPGFVWAASFNSKGRGILRFFAIDPSALLPPVTKEGLFTLRRNAEATTGSTRDLDGPAAPARSVDECEEKCAQSPNCKIFTYNRTDGMCYTYLRADFISNEKFVSGIREESTVPVAPPATYANPQNDCDRLAANPSDRRKPPSVPGVPYDSLMNQARQAIDACAVAVRQNPAELRYQYQMARAKEAEAPEEALEIHKKLTGHGYPAAYDNLGWLMVKLYKNYGEAVTYFKTGSRLQDPDSMVSLVEMIDRGYIPTDRPHELKYQLLRTAADLGHQGAQLQVREEEENLSPAQRQAVQDLRILKDFLGVR